MPILNIEPVSRRGMRFLISLYGLSETGKTLSGLKLAAGIEPDPKRRGLLDAEGGQRGRAYVDHIDGGYLYGALTPPFTPERYIEALAEFEASGVNVLVIDTVSHAWFAEGGVLDMVESATEKNDMAKWKKPKRRLAKMTNRLLSSDMHIILCSRAKQPLIKQGNEYVPGPVVPVQEKSLRYDMTIMAQMLGDGRFTVAAPAGKCPGVLRPIFEAQQVMSEDTGRQLMKWMGQQGGKSAEVRKLEADAFAAAEQGKSVLIAFKDALPDAMKDAIRPLWANLTSVAKAADAEADERAKEAREAAINLNDPFGAPVKVRHAGADTPAFTLTAADGEVLTWEDAADAEAVAEEFAKELKVGGMKVWLANAGLPEALMAAGVRPPDAPATLA